MGIKNVDTRALVTHIRENGAQNAIISSENTDIDELKKQLSNVPSMKGLGLAKEVSCTTPYETGDGDYDVEARTPHNQSATILSMVMMVMVAMM